MNILEAKELTKCYGRTKALNQVSFVIEEAQITGLIGRNGAGKTTLLKILAGHLQKSGGSVHVLGADPFNNLNAAANTVFIDEHTAYPSVLPLGDILRMASDFYAGWDMELAKGLADYFNIPLRMRHPQLSKGMRSTFNSIVGLCARCSVTLLDEPTTGMDAAVRKDFYRALLKDYIAHPRTILLSSHLLIEIEDILENVLLMDQGTLLLQEGTVDLKEWAIGLRGSRDAVLENIQGRAVYHQETFGKNGLLAVVRNDFHEGARQDIASKGVERVPVSASDTCVYLTKDRKEGIDHVFERNRMA